MAITLEIESISVDSVNLRWLDSVDPTDTFEIWRSEDGSNFDQIDTTAASATTYEDSGLEPETRYWYKVINEAAVESAEKSVVTQACWTPSATNELAMALPTSDQEVTSDEFNDAMRRLEAIIRNQSGENRDCVACSVNGALVLNCSEGCRDFVVDISEDINSISIIGCEGGGPGSVEFEVPAGECYAVCGFPAGFGFSGQECFDTEICGGDDGRGVKVAWSGGSGTGGSSGAAGGFGGAAGVKANTPSGAGSGAGIGGGGGGGGGTLTITCLKDDGSANSTCSMHCGTDKAMKFRVNGGRPPYTVSSNVSGATVTKTSSNIYRVTPPANSGSAVAGVAYRKAFVGCDSGALNATICASVGCDDVAISCGSHVDIPGSECGGSAPCGEAWENAAPCLTIGTHGSNCTSGFCSGTPGARIGVAQNVCADLGNTLPGGATCDARTAGMISSGCAPCGVVMAGSTFSVTDSLGVTVVKVLRS